MSYESVVRVKEADKSVEPADVVERSNMEEEKRPTHVAFGKRVPIPEHILTSRKVSVSDEVEGGRQPLTLTLISSLSHLGPPAYSLEEGACPLDQSREQTMKEE